MFVRGLYEGLTGVQSGALPIPYWPDAKQITIFSDYSDKFGDWTTYAFLCSPSEKFDELATTLLDLRKCHNLEDGRRFEYKSMRDKKRWSAISDWLDAFDMLTGLVVVLLVHKDVVSVFYANADNELDQLTKSIGKWGFGDWGTTRHGGKLLEDALRVVHSVSFLHAYLTGANSALYWISDNDEIVAGTTRRTSVNQLLANVATKYAARRVSVSLSIESEIASSPLRDFLSIPDLAAACVLQHQRGLDSRATDAAYKDAVLMEWFGKVRELQKIALRITPGPDNNIHWELYRPGFDPLTAEASPQNRDTPA